MHQLFWMSWAPARSSSMHPVALILHHADITNAKHSSCSPELRLPVPAELNNPSLAGNQILPPHTHTHPPLLCLCDCMVENAFFPGWVCCWARQLSRLTAQSHKQKQALSVAAVSCWSNSALHYIHVCWNHSSSFLTFLFLTGVISPSLSAMRAAAESIWRQLSTPPGQFSWQTFTMALQQAHKGLWICSSSAAPEHTAQDRRNRAFFLSRLPGPVSKTAVTEHSNRVWLNNTE